jgi:hypothetical protein
LHAFFLTNFLVLVPFFLLIARVRNRVRVYVQIFVSNIFVFPFRVYSIRTCAGWWTFGRLDKLVSVKEVVSDVRTSVADFIEVQILSTNSVK